MASNFNFEKNKKSTIYDTLLTKKKSHHHFSPYKAYNNKPAYPTPEFKELSHSYEMLQDASVSMIRPEESMNQSMMNYQVPSHNASLDTLEFLPTGGRNLNLQFSRHESSHNSSNFLNDSALKYRVPSHDLSIEHMEDSASHVDQKFHSTSRTSKHLESSQRKSRSFDQVKSLNFTVRTSSEKTLTKNVSTSRTSRTSHTEVHGSTKFEKFNRPGSGQMNSTRFSQRNDSNRQNDPKIYEKPATSYYKMERQTSAEKFDQFYEECRIEKTKIRQNTIYSKPDASLGTSNRYKPEKPKSLLKINRSVSNLETRKSIINNYRNQDRSSLEAKKRPLPKRPMSPHKFNRTASPRMMTEPKNLNLNLNLKPPSRAGSLKPGNTISVIKTTDHQSSVNATRC